MIKEEGLRDWFGKSKSKDGKKGWVNVVTGDSCASDKPGEGVPKCVSSSKRASMSKKERKAAAAAKRREDPGQQSKSGAAKPTMVKTDRKVRKEDMDINEAKDKKGKGSGSKDACYHKVKSRYSVWPSAYASGALVKCRKVGAANWGNSSKNEEFMALPEFSDIQINAMRKAGIEVEVIDEKCWKGYEKKGMKTMFGKRYPNCVKKEEVDTSDWRDDYTPTEIETTNLVEPEPIKGGIQEKINPALKGILKKTPKGEDPKKGGVPYKITGKMSEERERVLAGLTKKEETIEEATRTKVQTGNMYQVIFGWRGKMMMVKLFFPDVSVPTRQKVAAALDKMYPGSLLRSYSQSVVDYDDPYINVGEETIKEEKKKGEKYCRLCEKRETRDKCAYGPSMFDKYSVDDVKDSERENAASESGISEDHSNWRSEIKEGAAWTKKSGKNPSGGLNEKGRKSYERENPGSDLKAPSKKPGNKRRASFCARMKGMKKKLTSAKTANEPDSRINESLRAWNC